MYKLQHLVKGLSFHMITHILMLYVAYFSVSDSLCICTIGEGKRSSSTRSRERLTCGRSGVLVCTGSAAKVSKQHVLTSKRLCLYKHLIFFKTAVFISGSDTIV